MSSRARRRAAWSLGLWALACGLCVAVGARPQPALLAVLVGAGGAVAWGLADLARQVDLAGWGRDDEPVSARRGNDPRVSTIARLLRDHEHPLDLLDRVRPVLVGLVDERLDTRYGVDRVDHPAAARTLLGDELLDFAAGADGGQHRRGHGSGAEEIAYLSRLLDRAEAL